MSLPLRRGLYFEEFEEGQSILTAGRTITETDIVTFAGLSGDYSQIHTDAEYSRTALSGQRVAHGLLGLSIASGLAVQTGFIEGTVIVFREISNWKFSKLLFIGDTIHVRLDVIETRPMRRLGGGLVGIKLTVINQQDEAVMSGLWKVLVASRPAAES